MEGEMKAQGASGDGGLSIVPDALASRARVVSLRHQTRGRNDVVVYKWSAIKLQEILRLVGSSFNALTPDQMGTITSGGLKKIIPDLVDILGGKAFDLVDLSLDVAQRGISREMDAEDFIDVLDVVIDLNLTGHLIKKVTGLVAMMAERVNEANKSR